VHYEAMNVNPLVCQAPEVHVGVSYVIVAGRAGNHTSDFLDKGAKVRKSGRFVAGSTRSDKEHQMTGPRGGD
jgi:hypothetical protein